MTIREYAKLHNHKVVGKLTRHPEWEYEEDAFGEKKHVSKSYSDEGGNVYHVTSKGICIVNANDEII